MDFNELFLDVNNLPDSLSINELNDLFKKMSLGNIEAREKIINHNIKLVIFITMKKFNKINYDKKELVSIGIIGLINAVDTFDMTKNFKFSTYASTCIFNEIHKHLDKINKYNN